MNIDALPLLVRDTKRFHEVASTLAKYGMAPWMRSVRADWVQKLFLDREGEHIADLSQPARLREALTELGTTFIKLGQILSTRPDLLGSEWTEELAKLQSSAPADPPESVRQTIEAELGASPESLFAEFDDRPFASASIGQVHLARLREGPYVVVKVQHPGIEGRIRSDREILKQLARLAERYAPHLAQYRPLATAEELSRILLGELDFSRERRNLETFTRNFAGRDDVRIPRPYAELSSHRVLTMDRLEGLTVKDTEQLVRAGYDLSDIARRGANMYLDMVFRDGFYHADPHPGNLLVLPGGAIGLLDCGMVGRIDQPLREQFEELLLAAVAQDSRRLADLAIRLGTPPPDLNEDGLRAEIDEFLAEVFGQTLAEFDLSGALNRVISIIRRYGIILPSRVSLLLKVFIMLEGTARHLRPDFSLAALLQPYQAQIVRQRLSPQRLRRRIRHAYQDWSRLLDILPSDLADILRQIKRGRFDVHLEHRRLESTANRLVMGLLTAALFIGSAQLWSREVPPLVHGVSLPGAAGCAVAVGLGFRLLRAIKRSGDIVERDSP